MWLNIYTPNKVVYQGEVESFTAYTHKGKIGILTNHTSLITSMTSNVLEFTNQGQQNLFWVWGGLLHFLNNEAVILVDNVESIEDIDVNRAHESEKRAEVLLKEATENVDSTIDIERVKRSLERARMRIRFSHMR